MTSIKCFWSLALHRHQKQHYMSSSFGQSGCQKTMVKNENFHAKYFLIYESYIKHKHRTCTIRIQKEKVWLFAKKILFLKYLIFFQRGTLWCQNCQKNFFHFSKISKTKLKNDFYGTIQTWTETKSWILVVIAPTL